MTTNESTWKIVMPTGILLALLAAVACSAASAGPDSAGYTATDQTAYSFQNIAASGARVLAGTDDDSATVNIGFSFTFYGQSYSGVCISTNGLLAFGSCNTDFANVDLSSAAPGGDARVIAPFWTDLNFNTPGSDAVYYQMLGNAPLRQFVVQWNAAFPLNGRSGVTFQVVLYEGSNQIRAQYLSVGAGANGNAATVGIRDSGSPGNGRVLQWSYNAPVLKDGAAILFTPPGGVSTMYQVTTAVSPAGAGVVTGGGQYPSGSNATLTAQANPGYAFDHWSGGVGTSTVNPLTIKVDGPKQAVANFTTLLPVLSAALTTRTGASNARVWTVQLKNTGSGAASDVRLTGITFTPTVACTAGPTLVTPLPILYGTIASGGATASQPITVDFSGCGATTRFSVKYTFQANAGAYSGSTTANNLLQ